MGRVVARSHEFQIMVPIIQFLWIACEILVNLPFPWNLLRTYGGMMMPSGTTGLLHAAGSDPVAGATAAALVGV